MSSTLINGLSAKKKTELNEKLKANNLSLPVDKYNLYLLPNSNVYGDGVASDHYELKEKTIDLIKAKFDIKYDIDVFFNSENVEFYPLGTGSVLYNETVAYKELIRLL